MEKYEFIELTIHKKGRTKSVWGVYDGSKKWELFVEHVRGDYRYGEVVAMNILGQDGWFLGSRPTNSYRFTMQRKIQ